MDIKNDENVFTFVWQIENYRMNITKSLEKEYLISPAFAFKNIEWLLGFYRDVNEITVDQVTCYLFLNNSPKNPDKKKIYFEIFLVDNPFERPPFKPNKKYLIQERWGKSNFQLSLSAKEKRSYLRDNIYLICYLFMDSEDMTKHSSKSTDTLQMLISPCFESKSFSQDCANQIIESVTEDLQKLQKKICQFPSVCFCRSVIPTEKKSLSWPLMDILNSLHSKYTVLLPTISDTPDLLLTFIIVDLNLIKVNIQAITAISSPIKALCKVTVTDSVGKAKHSTENEHIFKTEIDWNFEFQIMSELKENSSQLNNCYLYCNISISKGIATSWIENIPYFDLGSQNTTEGDLKSSTLYSKMRSMFDAKQFCDVDIQLRNKTVQAHKAILCANSPVFTAMFENNMKENATNTINIYDLDADTLDRLLLYMYTDSLDDMQFDAAMKLYEAADKYQVSLLREKCALFMKTNLTIETACPALCLADAHQDQKFKDFVSHFIFQRSKEVLCSEEWKLFSEENLQLANEILQDICLKMSHIQLN